MRQLKAINWGPHPVYCRSFYCLQLVWIVTLVIYPILRVWPTPTFSWFYQVCSGDAIFLEYWSLFRYKLDRLEPGMIYQIIHDNWLKDAKAENFHEFPTLECATSGGWFEHVVDFLSLKMGFPSSHVSWNMFVSKCGVPTWGPFVWDLVSGFSRQGQLKLWQKISCSAHCFNMLQL